MLTAWFPRMAKPANAQFIWSMPDMGNHSNQNMLPLIKRTSHVKLHRKIQKYCGWLTYPGPVLPVSTHCRWDRRPPVAALLPSADSAGTAVWTRDPAWTGWPACWTELRSPPRPVPARSARPSSSDGRNGHWTPGRDVSRALPDGRSEHWTPSSYRMFIWWKLMQRVHHSPPPTSREWNDKN